MEFLIRLLALFGALMGIVALVVLLVTSIVLLLRAFRESVLWGVACLFLPLAMFLFVVRYWHDMRRLAMVYLAALGGMIVGAGLAALHPDYKGEAATALRRQRERFEALKEASEPVNPKAPSKSLRRQQLEFEKVERERARVAEVRQRATELFAYVNNWREDLMRRQPAENAPDRVKAKFRAEHLNYSGLLEEYKRAAEEVKKMELEFMKQEPGLEPAAPSVLPTESSVPGAAPTPSVVPAPAAL